jgi:hypothetical protein
MRDGAQTFPLISSRRSRRSRILTAVVSVGLAAGGVFVSAAPAGAAAAWSRTSSPNPSGSTGSTLSAVACPTTTSCFAVGRYTIGATTKTLAEHWNGSSWSIESSPNPGSGSANLSGVACPSAHSCFAVGSYAVGSAQNALVEHWNGHGWGLLGAATPSNANGVGLTGVSCPALKSCFAVGSFSTSTTTNTLAEHWNGSSWSVVSSPNPAGSTAASLRGVSCPSGGSCFAVGVFVAGSTTETLAEHWNGHGWGLQTSRNPGGATSAALTSVSCPATKNCFAVGNYSTGSGAKTLAEHWNGSSWSVESTSNPSSAASLNSVSCPSTKTCFAVGNSTVKNLIEHWNGNGWGTMSVPSPKHVDHAAGVACPSLRICFAVGGVTNTPPGKTMTLRYR